MSDSVAVVTGAGGAIGRAIVARLVSDGVRVVAADLSLAAARETVAATSTDGETAFAASVDVRDASRFLDVMRSAQDRYGYPVDKVVANAGRQTFVPFDRLTGADWDDIMDVNARGTFHTVQCAVTEMAERGVHGAVVAVASIQGRLGSRYYAHYSASKAATLNVVKSAALWAAPHQIRVNAVAPGMVDSPLWDRADQEMATIRGVAPGVPRAERVAQVPLGRAGAPEDVAGAVAFLMSADASYITGECLHVCGGDLMV